MVTAKLRRTNKRKLHKRELVIVFTPGMLNQRTGKLKKNAFLHVAHAAFPEDVGTVACGRDLGRVYSIPFNWWVYDLAPNMCRTCRNFVRENIASVDTPEPKPLKVVSE